MATSGTVGFLFRSEAKIDTRFCSELICDDVAFPGNHPCGIRNPGGAEFDICCPAGTTCCFGNEFKCACCQHGQHCCQTTQGNASGKCCDDDTQCCTNDKTLKTQCCFTVEKCCPMPNGGDSGQCCPVRWICCISGDGSRTTCCDPDFEKCCANANGAASGKCCPVTTSCCRNAAGIATVCCEGNDRCCENHCCKPLEVNGRFVDSCCGPGCCNGDRPVCCDISTALCCKTGECCGGGAAGIGKCCEPPLECCKGPGGVPIDCCDPNKGEICDNGVCRQAPKFAYNGSGGGKALAETDSTVSIFRFTVSGSGSLLPPNGVADTTSITGNLDAFNYKTRTRITMSQFTGFEGLLGNGTTTIAVAGHALVNGVPMLVNFSARKAGGVITFELKNANTNVALAEGIGEAGRAAISLTVQ